jgi:hypothetical protein
MEDRQFIAVLGASGPLAAALLMIAPLFWLMVTDFAHFWWLSILAIGVLMLVYDVLQSSRIAIYRDHFAVGLVKPKIIPIGGETTVQLTKLWGMPQRLLIESKGVIWSVNVSLFGRRTVKEIITNLISRGVREPVER